MPHLVISTLGSFQVRLDGEPLTGFKSRYVRALLAILAVEARRPQAREALAGLLWPECPNQTALSNLRYAISNLRQVLGDRQADPPYLIISRETIQFNSAGDYELDLDGLAELAPGAFGLGQVSMAQQEPAPVLFRGGFLEDFSLNSDAFEDWVRYWRARVNNQLAEALNRLAAHYEASGSYPSAAACARRLIELDAWDERAHRLLIRALTLNGQKSAAIAQYEQCRRLLEQELGMIPSQETTRLYQELCAGKWPPEQLPPPEKAAGQPFFNIPVPLTSFIGRQAEMGEIRSLLSRQRLLSLVGPGGCGKTRLANEIGHALAAARIYKDGVWWIDLAPLGDAELLPQAIAAALGLRESAGNPVLIVLIQSLRSRQALLVLDNCEHLLAACARLVETLLGQCPHLQILATSRESLNLGGESTFNVPPLSLPPPGADQLSGELLKYEALRLFAERAAAVLPGFKLVAANAAAVLQICQHLDGIPLAIELAAVRTKVLSIEQISARLDDRFQMLASGSTLAVPRHRTLRAAIDWSYDLLTEAERALLRSLAIFASSFSLAAVEALCDPLPAVPALDLLTRLVDKSLVMVQPQQPEARYSLGESLRQYALEKLHGAGEMEQVAGRLLEHYLRLAAQAGLYLGKPDQTAWLDRLEMETNNLRGLLTWALNGGAPEQGLRLADLLARFWHMRGYLSEGRQWLQKALEACPQAPGGLRATAQAAAGFLAFQQGMVEEAVRYGEESLALWRAQEDPAGMASALMLLGAAAHFQGDTAREAILLKESLAFSRASHQQAEAAYTLLWMGRMRLKQGDFALAAELLAESLKLYQEIGDTDSLAFAVGSLGDLARAQGDYLRAANLRKEGLRLAVQAGSKSETCYGLEHLALIAAAQGENERAVLLWGVADSLRSAMQRSLFPSYEAEYQPALAAARASLGEERFRKAWRQGSAMPIELAVEFALQ